MSEFRRVLGIVNTSDIEYTIIRPGEDVCSVFTNLSKHGLVYVLLDREAHNLYNLSCLDNYYYKLVVESIDDIYSGLLEYLCLPGVGERRKCTDIVVGIDVGRLLSIVVIAGRKILTFFKEPLDQALDKLLEIISKARCEHLVIRVGYLERYDDIVDELEEFVKEQVCNTTLCEKKVFEVVLEHNTTKPSLAYGKSSDKDFDAALNIALRRGVKRYEC